MVDPVGLITGALSTAKKLHDRVNEIEDLDESLIELDFQSWLMRPALNQLLGRNDVPDHILNLVEQIRELIEKVEPLMDEILMTKVGGAFNRLMRIAKSKKLFKQADDIKHKLESSKQDLALAVSIWAASPMNPAKAVPFPHSGGMIMEAYTDDDKPQPMATVKPEKRQQKAKTKSNSSPKPKAKTNSNSSPKPKASAAKPKPKSNTATTPKPKVVSKTKSTGTATPKAVSKTSSNTKPKSKTASESSSASTPKQKSKPQSNSNTTPKAKTASKTNSKATPKPKTASESNSASTPKPKPKSKSNSNTTPKPKAVSETNSTSAAKPKSKPHSNSNTTPKAKTASKSSSVGTPKPKPKSNSNSGNTPKPKATSGGANAPKVNRQPKVTPKSSKTLNPESDSDESKGRSRSPNPRPKQSLNVQSNSNRRSRSRSNKPKSNQDSPRGTDQSTDNTKSPSAKLESPSNSKSSSRRSSSKNPKPKPKPEASKSVSPSSEAKPKPKSQSEVKPKAKTNTTSQSKSEAKPKPKSRSEVSPKAKTNNTSQSNSTSTRRSKKVQLTPAHRLVDDVDEALFVAVKQQNLGKLTKLLETERNSDINAFNENTITLLMMAAVNGLAESVDFLLQSFDDIDVNKASVKALGYTALHFAAYDNRAAVIDVLIERCDADQVTDDGETALYLAARRGCVQAVRALYGAGRVNSRHVKLPEGFTPLVAACLAGHVAVVRELMYMGDGVKEIFDFPYKGDRYSLTPFHMACRFGQLGVVKMFMQMCMNDINFNDEGFECRVTPLYLAARFGHINVVKHLLNAVPWLDVNKGGLNGNAPLYAACRNGHIDIVKFLLKQEDLAYEKIGDERDTEDNGKEVTRCWERQKPWENPVFVAHRMGHPEIVKLLIDTCQELGIEQAPVMEEYVNKFGVRKLRPRK